MKLKLIIFLVMCAYFTHAQEIAEGMYTIENLSTGKLMNISGAATNNGAPLIQWPESGARNELFYVKQLSNGTYTIMNLNSRLNLNVVGSTNPQYNQSGTQVTQYAGEWGAMQWNISLSTDSSGYIITSAFSGKPIGIYDANNTAVIQWALNAQVDSRFKWNFNAKGGAPTPGRYLLQNIYSGNYLGVDGANTNWGAPVSQTGYNAQPYQQFDLSIEESSGNYIITNVNSGLNLTVTGNSDPQYNTNGASIAQWGDRSAPQQWVINQNNNVFSDGYYIQSAFSGKYMSTYNNGGTSVVQYENNCWCANNLYEWRLIPIPTFSNPEICTYTQVNPGSAAGAIDYDGSYWHIGNGDYVWNTMEANVAWSPTYIANTAQHFQAKQLIASRGKVYARTASNLLYEYVDDAWQYTNAWCIDFAIDGNGTNWHIGSSNFIYRRNDDGTWQQVPGQGKQIRANGGTVALIGMNNQLYVWNEDIWSWTFIGGAGLDPSLLPFDVDQQGNIWRIDRVNNNTYFWNSTNGWVNANASGVDRLFTSSTSSAVYIGNGNNVWQYRGVNLGWELVPNVPGNINRLTDALNNLYILSNSGAMYITSNGCNTSTATSYPSGDTNLDDIVFSVPVSNTRAFTPETQNNAIKIYPNPAKSTVNVALGNRTDKVTIQLFDVSGKVKQTNNTGGAIRSLDVSGLSNGIYLMKIYGANGELLKNEKVAVEK